MDLDGENIREPEILRLKNECEQTWEKIHQTYSRIQARKESCPPRGIDADEDSEMIQRQILQAKENKIKAEINALQEREMTALTIEMRPDASQMKSKLTERAAQLEKTILVIKNKKQEAEKKLKREEEILMQNEEIQQSIKEKIKEEEMEKENFCSPQSEVRNLEGKRKKVEQQLSVTVKQLGSFIKEHFPLPTVDDQKYTPLQGLLEVLIEKLFNSPQDPYIPIMSSYWPPYIELLLRCGIVLRHPQNSNLIKLESFQA